MVAASIDKVVSDTLIPAILVHPRIQIKQCDQLIALFLKHRAQVVDLFVTGVEANYLMSRFLIRTFEEGVALTADAKGQAVEKRLDHDGRVRYFIKLFERFSQLSDPSKRVDPRSLQDPQFMAKAAAQFDSLKLNFPRERKAVDDWTRSMLALRTASYRERILGADTVIQKYSPTQGGKLSDGASLFLMMIADSRSLIQVSVNDPIYTGAAQCLVALKRWEILRQGKLVSLAAVCRAANLPSIPIDGYSGAPLRLVLISGTPVIYSIGPDGHDDGGRKEYDFGRNTNGDLIFRLPKSANSMGQ